MNLELKHLACYLPYELEGVANFLEDTIFIVTCISVGKIKGYTKYGNNVNMGCLKKEFKPILRPLSDLTKQIEVNGEKFIPIVKINELYGSEVTNYHLFITQEFGMTTKSAFNRTYLFDSLYEPIQKLFEWHFDIFNLIENGLAININELNK